MKNFLTLILAILSINAFADVRLAFKTNSFRAFVGTPLYSQTHGEPTNVSLNQPLFEMGALTFNYNRDDGGSIQWLTSIESVNGVQVQHWVDFPGTADNMAHIAVLPILRDKLYWFTSEFDNPTPNEQIPSALFDGTYGMLWWNKSTAALFKLSSYVDNGDGTYTQTWTQIVGDSDCGKLTC